MSEEKNELLTQEVNQNIYKAYKPLRNHLSKVEVVDSLYVIWAYIRNIEKGVPFPKNIDAGRYFANFDFIQKIRILAPWELEILAREIIIHSYLNLPSPHTFRAVNYFGRAIDKLKAIDGAVSKEYLRAENVISELEGRLAHRQFAWQISRDYKAHLPRYFKIFSHPKVTKIIESAVGLSVHKIFGIGVILWNHFNEKFVSTSINFDLPEINNTDVANFEKIFFIEISALKEVLKREVQVNHKFNYSFHSLKRFPILCNSTEKGVMLICPFPDLVFKQITGGIYYLIKEWTGEAGNALGEAFQEYIGDLLNACELKSDYTIIREERMEGSGKDTVDWIVTDGDSALFIECKTTRLTMHTKEELSSNEKVEKDVEKIAKAILQIYKTIRDYRADLYPNLRFKENLKIYPIVITMEEWFLMGNRLAEVHKKVSAFMLEENFDIKWLELMPYSICSAQEFELIAQLLNEFGIPTLIHNKQTDKEMRGWTYHAFLSGKYREQISKFKEIFPLDSIFKEILPISFSGYKQ